VVANVGDARAVLCINDVAIRLSFDHKATEPSEVTRIKDAGSFVVHGRLGGSLAVSRALGDIEFKKWGLSAEPYVTETVLGTSEENPFLILACDGLWDVVSDQEAVDLIIGMTETSQMTEKLLSLALEKGTKDYVTIMGITL